MKTIAIIAAGGEGKRIEGNLPKQFLMLKDKLILAHTVDKFERCELIDEIILVVPEDYLEYCSREVVDKYGFKKVRKVICGGKERQDSVHLGLKSCPNNTSIAVIHDGVRPLISPDKISESIKICQEKNAVVLVVPVKDTVKRVEHGNIITTLDRKKLWLTQTPQTFEYKLILEAYEKAKEDNFVGTDDSVLVERLGYEVTILEGDYKNIKITTIEDLQVAEKLLEVG
ncbi:MAG: 2-C-methyl-D-erythritol 4-phosphate cytidylyltransferase [candidate division Zixibacteria bacterium]|nr:2-C-methyl-D-erythritol 4-phosphate cytidylyltransferase [candidate division Zixibacteria bacterium]